MSSNPRRDFLKTVAAAVPAAVALPAYQAKASPLRKKVKITDVKAMVVKGTAPWNMVKIETDSGITGLGEAYWGHGVKDVILGYLRPLLLGEDPLNVEPLYTKMLVSTDGAGSLAGVTVTAISGVEIALWDLAGKILGAPVYTLLGGRYRDSVRAYWTSQPTDILDKASCRAYASMIKDSSLGITAVKPAFYSIPELPQPWHASPDRLQGLPTTHLTRKALSQITKGYENIREALGEDIDIAVHCHWEYAWNDALRLARAVAPIDPMWLEDPMPPAYSDSWAKLTQESPVPILTGENLYRVEGFAPFILNQGVHKVQIDIPKAGGLLEAKKIADLAAMHYLPICGHNASSPVGAIASAHVAAAMRDFRALEYSPGNPQVYASAVNYDGPIIKDGNWQILDKPGLGIELNEDYVHNHLLPGEQWWG
jgi:L-alanine-DL-glutamate epimerase-like enolase superfamily enzyme